MFHPVPYSKALPRWLRARTPALTPLISAPQPQPLLCAQLQLSVQFGTWILPVDEIAETASDTSFSTIEPAACFAEIGNGREFAVDRSCGIPARVERIAGLLRRVFVLEARVHVAD